MPNYLVMDGLTGGNGGTCQVFLYTNGTPAQIGNSFGTSRANAGGNLVPQRRNDAIQFGGELYAVALDGVYQKDDPATMTGDWSKVLNFTRPEFTPNASSTWGIHAMEVNGVMSLVGVYKDDSLESRWNWFKFDGTTWTEAPAYTNGNSGPHILDAIVYHGAIHVIGTNGASPDPGFFDPATNTFGTPTESPAFPSNINNHAFCVFDDRLFLLCKSSAFNTMAIWEFSGGAWSVVKDNVGFVQNNSTIAKGALFTDGTYMWASWTGSSGGNGYLLYQFDTALNMLDKSADTLPTNLLHTAWPGGVYADNEDLDRLIPVYDLNSVVGTTDIYLFRTTSGNGLWTVYKWNGNAAIMTVVDTGGNALHSVPSGFPSFGERIFTAGELDIKIIAREGVPGGEKITFTVSGGGTNRKMKLHHSLKGTPPLLSCTLSGPVTGGSATFNVGLNQVEGIDADGTTVYTVVWTPGVDGLSVADRVFRVPEALI